MKFDLRSWLTGYALGLAGTPLPFAVVEKRKPVAYLYNGVRLPKLPEAIYPHAYITKIAGAVSTPAEYMLCFTAEPVYTEILQEGHDPSSVVNGSHIAYYYNSGKGVGWEQQCNGKNDTDGHTDMIHWPAMGPLAVWCNTDIPNPDGSVYLASSFPAPWYDSEWWETKYEGTVTTESVDGYKGARARIDVTFSQGVTRITVNGESAELTVVNSDFAVGYYIGNAWLAQGASTTHNDNGYDYCITNAFPDYFYSRNPGTYTVKLERRMTYEL